MERLHKVGETIRVCMASSPKQLRKDLYVFAQLQKIKVENCRLYRGGVAYARKTAGTWVQGAGRAPLWNDSNSEANTVAALKTRGTRLDTGPGPTP